MAQRRGRWTTAVARLAAAGLAVSCAYAAFVAGSDPEVAPAGRRPIPDTGLRSTGPDGVPAGMPDGLPRGHRMAAPPEPGSAIARRWEAPDEAAAPEARDAWGPATSVPAQLDRPIGRYVPERWGLAVDPDALDDVHPGSRLRFWMPDRPSLVAVVTEVRRAGDTVGVHADLEGLPSPFGMVLTQRGLTLLASVVAPEGNYRIEGVGGAGALEKEEPAALIDPAKADALDPRTAPLGLPVPVAAQ